MIIAGIASIPERQASLWDTVSSLYNQVDEIALVLNGYEENPFEGWIMPKLKVYMSAANIGDQGKFALMHEYKDSDYWFACDDDIIYPTDFTSKMISKLKEHEDFAVIGCHGRIMAGQVKSYYNDTKMVVHFQARNEEDKRVNVAAMNSACFKVGNLRLTLKDFPLKNMTDIFVAIKAQKMKMPVVIIKHEADWIIQNKVVDLKKSIYSTHRDKDEAQTKMINSVKDWTIY